MILISSLIKPVKFHPYTSRVLKRIYSGERNKGLDYFEDELIETFNKAGIKCYKDNKIVFEVETYGQKLFYGFYDCSFHIGFDYFDENEK